MSLVVAHRISYGVRVAADMRVVDPNAGRPVPNYHDSVLKVVVVHPRVCVGFAGLVWRALDIIRGLKFTTGSIAEIDAALESLLAGHQRRRDVDFLLAAFHPTILARVSAGCIERDLQNAWIGDHKAFSLFQTVYNGDQPSYVPGFKSVLTEAEYSDILVANRSARAMEAVIESDLLPNVGEARICVVPRPPTAPTAFGYCESSHVDAEQGLQRPLSPANGDFSVALLSADPGIGAVGLFFVVAQLGLLHHPLALDHPEPFRCVSLNAFKDQVREKYGFGLGGVGVGAHDAAG